MDNKRMFITYSYTPPRVDVFISTKHAALIRDVVKASTATDMAIASGDFNFRHVTSCYFNLFLLSLYYFI